MFVLTIDQAQSRSMPDRVDDLLSALDGVATVLDFERSVGDEIQGVIDDPHELARAIIIVLRHHGWHLGLGLGDMDGDPSSARAGSGTAFIHAREAVDRAKKSNPSVAVRGGDPELANEVEVVIKLVAAVEERRQPAQAEVVSRLEVGMSGAEIATELGITPQAVSQRRRAARYDVTSGVPDVLAAMIRRWKESA